MGSASSRRKATAWGPIDPGLGFLGLRPFGRENPQFGLLEKLGFPWILSSGSILINGLRGIFRIKISRAFFPAR
jgi:hypothetical protein